MRDERPTLTALDDVLRRVDLERPLFPAAHRRRVPEGEWSVLVALALVRDAGSATWSVCDQCDEPHEEEVSWSQWPRGVAPRPFLECPVAGNVFLAPEDLKQWLIDVPRLAELLADALSCAGRVEELVPGRLWLLGRSLVCGRTREVFLGRRLAERDAAAVVGNCTRFQAAVAPVVLVAGVVPDRAVWSGDAPPVLALPSFVTLAGGALVTDRAYLASALAAPGPASTAAPTASFPTPEGATWDEVRLVVTELDLEVTLRGRRRRFTFAEAGFEDARKGDVPDHLWRLLRLFALREGVIPFDTPDLARRERDNLKNLVSQLRRRLCALLQMPEDDPFRPTRRTRRYETRFAISTTADVVLPTPADLRWEDLSIREVAEDRLRFTWERTERRGAFRGGGDEDVRTEVAVHAGSTHREIDLVTLGLARADGRVTPEGAALREVLRAGGTVTRRATDQAMLALGARLSRLAQIDGSAKPFAFSEGSARWAAAFDASSALAPAAR